MVKKILLRISWRPKIQIMIKECRVSSSSLGLNCSTAEPEHTPAAATSLMRFTVLALIMSSTALAFVPRATLPLRHRVYGQHHATGLVAMEPRRAVASRTTPTAFIF